MPKIRVSESPLPVSGKLSISTLNGFGSLEGKKPCFAKYKWCIEAMITILMLAQQCNCSLITSFECSYYCYEVHIATPSPRER